jgi:hypothetical protein
LETVPLSDAGAESVTEAPSPEIRSTRGTRR